MRGHELHALPPPVPGRRVPARVSPWPEPRQPGGGEHPRAHFARADGEGQPEERPRGDARERNAPAKPPAPRSEAVGATDGAAGRRSWLRRLRRRDLRAEPPAERGEGERASPPTGDPRGRAEQREPEAEREEEQTSFPPAPPPPAASGGSQREQAARTHPAREGDAAREDEHSPAPRVWNLWELERLAREEGRRTPGRAGEWSYLFLHLRGYADAAGALPPEFDALVRESFGRLLADLDDR